MLSNILGTGKYLTEDFLRLVKSRGRRGKKVIHNGRPDSQFGVSIVEDIIGRLDFARESWQRGRTLC